MKSSSTAIAVLAYLTACAAHAAEVYGGGGTTGLEVGISQNVSDSIATRLDYNVLSITRSFTTSDINYDAKLKSSNAGAYVDYFVSRGFRLTGGALIGSRQIHGSARSIGNSITLNGVVYPTTATDTLGFDAKFPTVTPYLGVGYGHNGETSGLRFYADAGVAYGRPKVQLSPSASLAAKVAPADLADEQSSAQSQADSLRYYPVIKLGVNYRF